MNTQERQAKSDRKFSTSDFLEITYLLSMDVPLLGVSRLSEANRVLFFFDNEDACLKLIGGLGMGNDQVSASRMLEAIRKARRAIRSV